MDLTEQLLEFDKIKELWMEFALTEGAKKRIADIAPCMSETELTARQRETTEARVMLEKGGNPPLVSLSGINELLIIANQGGCLNAEQLTVMEQALAAIRRLKDYLNRCKQYGLSLPWYEENLEALGELRETIHMQIRNGKVEDGASKLLKTLRSDIDRAENKMREKADAIMRANKACMSDQFSTIRNGHVCIPVKKEYKFKIGGSVIDKSSTGSTLFIEPAAAAKYYEELQILRIDEENEERRILYTLTAMISEASEPLEQNMRVMEKLDFIFSKGKLSLEYDGTEPAINTDRRIVLREGRHPLMDKKICVPMQFEIGNGINGIVITGPNTGGKTVAIKTVALNCIMAQLRTSRCGAESRYLYEQQYSLRYR